MEANIGVYSSSSNSKNKIMEIQKFFKGENTNFEKEQELIFIVSIFRRTILSYKRATNQ